MAQRYQWQIIYIIKFLKEEFPHPDYKDYLFSSLEEILSNVTSPEICIDFCLETDLEPSEILSNLTWSQTIINPPYFLLLRSNHGISPASTGNENTVFFFNSAFTLKLLGIDEEGSAADPEVLGQKLQLLQKDIEVENCAVITWDHGSAYGIFYEPERANQPIKSVKPEIARFKLFDSFSKGSISRNNENPLLPPGIPLTLTDPVIFRNIASKKSKSLTMDELAISLSLLKKGKADLVVMINCFMMTIDTQYALRNAVDYLLAPETAIHYQNYRFDILFKALSINPALTAKDVCKLLIQSIKNNPILTQDNYFEKIAVYSLFLTELNQLDFWKKFNVVCENLWNNLDNQDFLDQLLLKRKIFFTLPLLVKQNLSTLRLIDGISLLKKIATISYGTSELKASILTFCNVYEQSSLISNPDYYYTGKQAFKMEYACRGFSLYFPQSKGDFEINPFILLFYNDFDNENLSALAKDSFWDNFLYKLFVKMK